MFRKQVNLFRVVVALALVIFFIAGCSKKQEEEQLAQKIPFTMEVVPPGALPDVSAEMGGEGFTGEGWLSNEDYEPFGDPRAVKGGTLTWAYSELPPTTRPIGKDCNYALISMVSGVTYESMVGMDSNTLKTTPGLATHWQISDDKRTFRFRLNPKARWADGSRVTTEDVLATWKLCVDPSILFPSTNVTFGYYEEPIIESPYIISVTTTELNWRLFIYFGGMNVLPAKYIGHLKGSDYLREYQWEMVPGSGPYELKMENINKGISWTVTRRDHYWDEDNPKNVGVSNFDNIKFIVVPEDRLMFEKFKKGEIDIYQVGRAQWWVHETDFDDIQRGLIQKRKIFNDEPQGTGGIVFNMRKPPFDDIRMRQAMTYLWNRKKLIDNLFFNEYTYLDSYYAGGIYENANNPKYRYDPDKAIELLAECGYTNRNEEGLLVNADGNTLTLEMPFTAGLDRIFTVYQEDLLQVGIKMELKETTPATSFKMGHQRKFTMMFQNWTGLMFPNPETSWASWLADSANTNNFSGLKDDRLDELLKEYNVCFDQERRIEIIREIDGILMKIQPYALGWYAPFTRLLYWNKFGHPEAYYPRISAWYNSVPFYWWIDPDKQKRLEEAKNDPSIQLEVGATEVTYWPEWNKKHGRQYKSEF